MLLPPKRESMVSVSHPTFQNRLLRQLAAGDIAMLKGEPVDLALHDEIEPSDQPIKFAYFPESALASVVANADGRGRIEVGMVGQEGVTAMAILLGTDRSPFQTVIQGSGSAMRVPAVALRSLLDARGSAAALLLRYAQSFSVQLASTATANGRFKLEERLARWLVMVGDRMGEKYEITHEYIAVMLAVRRPGVTLALQLLESKGLIRSLRGTVMIVDRLGLIEATGGSYGLPEREYKRLLG